MMAGQGSVMLWTIYWPAITNVPLVAGLRRDSQFTRAALRRPVSVFHHTCFVVSHASLVDDREDAWSADSLGSSDDNP
jgi:hypothetical protein